MGGKAAPLVQLQYADLAARRAEELAAAGVCGGSRAPGGRGHSQPGLGLNGRGLGDVTDVWHLAAVYDLAVERELAVRVNVEGTRTEICWTRSHDVAGLSRFHYFSTCYVSGRYAGPFGEDDLEVGAPFNNYYEETKHEAEAEVRRRMAAGLPATIYRPSIVVGDSRTGETQKFDGPYFVMQWLLRQPMVAVLSEGRHVLLWPATQP